MYTMNGTEISKMNTLLAAREGVFSRTSGVNLNNNARSLVIGLGGVGTHTAAELKRKLVERIGILHPSRIQFLAIDTDSRDRNSILESGKLNETEFPLLDNSTTFTVLTQDKSLRSRYVNRIMPEDFHATAHTLRGEGANQQRLLGRLSLIVDPLYTNVCNAISGAIQKLSNFANSTLDVHIIAGIGGGTGSGMIIDVPYLVRRIANRLNIVPTKIHIFGHIYLPNIYCGNPNVNINMAYRNGYAALKEIDYYMTLRDINETFETVYADGSYSSNDNIFDQCTIIGGQVNNQADVARLKAKAIRLCADNLINQVTQVAAVTTNAIAQTPNQSISDVFTSGSFLTNSTAALTTVLSDTDTNKFKKGANYNFIQIGYASFKFPAEDIANKFLGRVYKNATEIFKDKAKNITQDDVNEFENDLIAPVDFIDKATLDFRTELETFIRSQRYLHSTERAANKIDPQLENISQKHVTDFNRKGDVFDDAMAAANARAGKIFSDIEKGPYFLEKLLTSRATDGGSVEGYFAKLEGYAESLVNHRTELEAALRTYIDNRKKYTGKGPASDRRYKEQTIDLYVCKFKIALCERLSREYVQIAQNLGAPYRMKVILTENYLKKIDYLEGLGEILSRNENWDAADEDDLTVESLNDPVFDALKITKDNAIDTAAGYMDKNKTSRFASSLYASFEAEAQKWFDDFPAEFRKFVVNYGDTEFHSIITRSFIDYLDLAYKGLPVPQRVEVVQRLKDFIDTKSQVMCTTWNAPYMDWNWLSPLKYKYMILPQTFTENANVPDSWGYIFSQLFINQNGNTSNIYASPDNNAVYSYSLYARLPLWINKDVMEYEIKYNDSNLREGLEHINENEEFRPSYYNYPPLFIQNQWFRSTQGNIVYRNDAEIEYKDYLRELIKYAEDHELIFKDTVNGKCYVRELDYPRTNDGNLDTKKIEKFVKNYSDDNANRDNKGVLKVQGQLVRSFISQYTPKQHLIILADPANEDSILENLRKQMQCVAILEKTIADYKKILCDGITEGQVKELFVRKIRAFAKWMFYGLIIKDSGQWKYLLGTKEYDITTKARVRNSGSWKADYMEIAAKDAFYSLDDWKKHSKLLDDRCEQLSEQAYSNQTIKQNITDNFNDCSATADKILKDFKDIEDRGDDLTDNQVTAREFYLIFREELLGLMDAFK